MVLNVGYVADRDLAAQSKISLDATLRMVDICTMVKGAIIGQSSPLNHDSNAISMKLSVGGLSGDEIRWKYLHPAHVRARLNANERKNDIAVGSGGSALSWTAAADPLTGLIEALISKLSAIPMIERDEVDSDSHLASYGLDSLVLLSFVIRFAGKLVLILG